MGKEFKSTIDFIKDLYGNPAFVPLHIPRFWGKEKEYLLDTIASTFVSSVGAYVNRFEEEMATLTGTAKAAAVVNGTAALQVALRIAGVQPGEEVITQALTFVATANAIAYNYAQPVFVDVDRDTMGMSATALEDFLETYGEKRDNGTFNKSTGKRIAACLPMHTFGFMCRIEEIVNICSQWDIPVVEDAAEALGSTYNGKPAGGFGRMGIFSFNGNKIITAGGGGALVSNDAQWAEKAKYLTTTAKVPHTWDYVHDELGYNYRMPNINAALLCAQLEQLDALKDSKRAVYEGYTGFFNNYDIRLTPIPEGTGWNYWLMSVELEDRKQRDAFLETTNANGIMTRPVWQLMYRLPMYKHCQRDDEKNAEYLEERIVNIPSSARED
ncbi:MAG: LegC family aminotransferase [Bacteroidia bacterium]